jgi:hypothetical protein
MMGAMIGPDLVIGIGGFGKTVPEALHNLADHFDRHGYSLSGNAVTVEVSGKLVSAEGRTPSDAIRNLARIVADRAYVEHDYPEPDWTQIAAERPIVDRDRMVNLN